MDLSGIFKYYCKECENTWNNSSVELFENIETYSKDSQKKREKELDKLLNTISVHLERYPSDAVLRKMWVKKGEVFLQKTLEKENIFKLEKMDVEDRKKFLEITKQFIRDARKFDDDLPIGDIMQAMRNVWISNALQLLFGKEVYYSKANFAYSMLYPYTDNYLDNTNIDKNDKILFNNWLEKRLLGEHTKSKDYHESKVSQMIDYIESVYPREKFTEVYESLLLIFKSQVNSLKQHGKENHLCKEDLLSISIEKGGSSVLVDGYLISGLMTKEEIEFCIGYGFLLQISDDLQDIKEDLKYNHKTIITEMSKEGTLDKVVNKLINFTIELIDSFKINNKNKSVITMIKNDCLMLILFSVVYNAEFFSVGYIKEVEKFIPYTIDYSLEIEEKIKEKVYDTLKICGLYEFRNWPISALSYGQKKRVTIASMLVLNPEVLILDEPTAGQDFKHYTEIMEFLCDLNKQGITIIMITHDMHLMLEYTNRAIVLCEGEKLMDDSSYKVLTNNEIIKKANLKETSLYELAVKTDLKEPKQFVKKFIDYDRRYRKI